MTRMPEHPYNPWHLQVHDWAAMFRDVWRYKDLRILYKHPDWVLEQYAQDNTQSPEKISVSRHK